MVAVALAPAASAAGIGLTKETDHDDLDRKRAAGAAGYVVSISTWPPLTWLSGVENEIDDLRATARALKNKLRG